MTRKSASSSAPTPAPIPDGYQSAIPMLAVQNAASAIEFYQRAFSATELCRLHDPDGNIAHAEIQIGQARLMLADEYPEHNISPQSLGNSTVIIHLYVENVDAMVNQAVSAGATLVYPVEDQFYGDRSGRLVDPFGHIWILASQIEQLSMDEIQQRFLAMPGVSSGAS